MAKDFLLLIAYSGTSISLIWGRRQTEEEAREQAHRIINMRNRTVYVEIVKLNSFDLPGEVIDKIVP
jgi:hypothetical protein